MIEYQCMSAERIAHRIINRFQRRLKPQEIQYGIDSARQVILEIKNHKDWTWLTGGIMYGSYIKGNPRRKSDLDIAFLMKIRRFVDDQDIYIALSNKLYGDIIITQNKLGITDLPIRPVLLWEGDLIHPEYSDVTNPKFIESVNRTSVRVF